MQNIHHVRIALKQNAFGVRTKKDVLIKMPTLQAFLTVNAENGQPQMINVKVRGRVPTVVAIIILAQFVVIIQLVDGVTMAVTRVKVLA